MVGEGRKLFMTYCLLTYSVLLMMAGWDCFLRWLSLVVKEKNKG